VSPSTSLPPGPNAPKLAQAVRYTFDWPRFSAANAARYGHTWTLKLPGFPPSVVTTDRDAIRDLFTGDPLTKRHANDLLKPLFGDRSLLLLDPAAHLARRKLELAPFHGDRVAVYREHIIELLSAEIDSWGAGTEVDVHPRAQALTLGVVLELLLGVRDTALLGDLTRVLSEIMRPKNSLAMFLPPAVSKRSRVNILSRSFWTTLDRLDTLIMRQIAATRVDPLIAERTDVLAMLTLARDEHGDALTDTDLRDELVTLVVAGHETTSTGIAWGVDLLAHHPETAAKLRKSLADGDREYLKATAKEVLRVRTVLPVTAARTPLEPFTVAGHTLPAGTIVLVNADRLHHDPALYSEPDVFRPERFLNSQPDSYAFLPFGGGARRCLGIPLALLELELTLEHVVSTCMLEPAGPPARPVRVGTTLAPGNRGRVRIVRHLSARDHAMAPA
jgi:cytochrome P450